MGRRRRSAKIVVRHADGRVEVVKPGHFVKRRPSRKWYMRTDHWKEVRRQAKVRDGWACSACGAIGVKLEGHHLTYERIGREWLEDVATVCQPCHAKAHRRQPFLLSAS